jgi:hypothetical protein
MDWQKQQYFSQVHCGSGLSHCLQSVVTVNVLPPGTGYAYA